MSLIKVDLLLYLKRAKELDIDPNFYLSEPYLRFFDAECFSKDGWLWIQVENDCLFPPLPIEDHYPNTPIPVNNVWSDFENCGMTFNQKSLEFLDWEYIYDPKQFNVMAGGDWLTFRKNCRKWPRDRQWDYVSELLNARDLENLVADWLTAHQSDVQDPELITTFVLDDFTVAGVYRKILYQDDGKRIAAVNVWDENYKYTNFRICICQPDPFLSEFARWLFYVDPDIQGSGKLVNDGGTLGNPGLEAFKDKMNPVRKRSVYSWRE